MIIFLKKILSGNNSIYYFGYIFYGMSIVLMSSMIMIIFYLNLYAIDNFYSNKKINDKKLVVKDFLPKDSSSIVNYNFINNSETQIDKYSFTTKDLNKIFDEKAYFVSSVRSNKLVPNISINKLPKDFYLISSIEDKKSLFIRSLLPLIITENDKIIDTKKRIKKIDNNIFEYITREDALWLKKQLIKYKVKSNQIDELLIKADIIPVSIALAQAAIESGWGTSRFATEGNALFGQWSWFKGSGIVPKERSSEETYEIKSFESLRDSVSAYMINLNSHKHYIEFRAARYHYRINNDEINSINLIKLLSNYAENKDYSNILEKIIKKNNLQEFDQAKVYRLPYELANLIAN